MAEVKALAEVLAEHEADVTSYDAGDIHGCDCGWQVPEMPKEERWSGGKWDAYHAHVEAAVLDWVRERLADARYAMAQALPGLLVDEYGEDPATWSELGSTRRLSGELSGIASEALGVGEVRG